MTTATLQTPLRLASIRHAALVLGVPERTLRGWAARGVIATVRIGGRRLVDLAALEALVLQPHDRGSS